MVFKDKLVEKLKNKVKYLYNKLSNIYFYKINIIFNNSIFFNTI